MNTLSHRNSKHNDVPAFLAGLKQGVKDMKEDKAIETTELTDEEWLEQKLAELEPRQVDEIPDDIEFASLEDLDDLEEGFTIVPLLGKSGKIQNWVVRSLTAGERSMIGSTMFPKTALQQISNPQPKKGFRQKKQGASQVKLSETDTEKMMDGMHERNCLAIKTGTVFPEKITIDRIKKLTAHHFDKLLNAIDKDVDDADVVARFLVRDI